MAFDLQDTLNRIPAVSGVGMKVEQTDDGLTFTAEIGPDDARYEGAEQAHGGSIASILDTAATFAVLAHKGQPWVTLEMTTTYLRAVPLGSVRGDAMIVHSGRSVALIRTAVYDQQDRRCVEASVLMMLPPSAKEGA